MDRIEKKRLQELYQVPAPERKEEFMKKMAGVNPGAADGQRERSLFWQQLYYLPKWCLAAVVFTPFLLLFLKQYFPEDLLSFSMAMIPFLAWMSVFGSIRSLWYGMDELEMAARFSLKRIMLARMEWMGLFSLLWGIVIAVMQHGVFLITMVHLMTPYLMTTFVCLLMAGREGGREQLYLITGVTMGFSAMLLFSVAGMRWIYAEQYVMYWLFFLIVAGGLVVWQCQRRKVLLGEKL